MRGVILLPRSSLPLNVFEPRYLALVNDALAGDRIIGIVQPHSSAGDAESPEGPDVPLRTIGTAGRLTAFQETDDNRILISLSGVARFEILAEVETDKPYRSCQVSFEKFQDDFVRGAGEDEVDRKRLVTVLKAYLKANKLNADWESIDRSANELLVNTLSVISPYGPEEKQALLEAESLKRRAEILIALAEMELAAPDSDSGSTLQ